MILGAVLAGGQSSRFGTDKALAEVDGHTLIAHAVDTLSWWCEHVIVVGRETAPAPTLPDWRAAGSGPLGGLAAALNFARDSEYEAVLSCILDSFGLPENLPQLLSPAPRYVVSQPVIGLWPAKAASAIEELLFSTRKHSMMAFAEMIGATPVTLHAQPFN